MNVFEQYLTLWVALCMAAGIGFGWLAPAPFHALGRATVAEINIPIALLGWLFIGWLFRSCLPAGQIDSYIAGLIPLAAPGRNSTASAANSSA